MPGPEDIIKNLAKLRGKQPMPSDLRMQELIGKFSTGVKPTTVQLPMDEASRMGRATEQGFTNDLYHGTTKNFSEFNGPVKLGTYGDGDFGIHATPRPETANRFTGSYTDIGKDSPLMASSYNVDEQRGANVMPLKVRMDKTLHMPKDVGIWRDPGSWTAKRAVWPEAMAKTNDREALEELLDTAADINHKYRNPSVDPNSPHRSVEWQRDATGIMQRRGIDSISYPNKTEGAGELSYLLMDPGKIRSRFAAFDPRNLGKKNILGAGAGAAIAGGAMSQADYDTQATAEQANDPAWKRAGRSALAWGTDAILGALGHDPGESASLANLGGQLLSAGLPMLPKGVPKALQNFRLPGGKMTGLDTNGVNRVLDSERADRMYQQITNPVSKMNRESGEIPTARGFDEVSDVSVPIADSLDTAATPKLPISQSESRMSGNGDPLKRKSTSVMHGDVLRIRELYEGGMMPKAIRETHFPDLNINTISEIARRMSFQRIK